MLEWLHLIMKIHGLLLKPFKRRNRMCHSRSDDEITCLKVHRASVDIKNRKQVDVKKIYKDLCINFSLLRRAMSTPFMTHQ